MSSIERDDFAQTLTSIKVARRYRYASQALAKSLDELTILAGKDLQTGSSWLKQFSVNTQRIAKQELEKFKSSVRNLQKTEGLIKEAEKMTKKVIDASKEFERNAGPETRFSIQFAVKELHDEIWDPEMFADGQTKADYPSHPLDPMMDALLKQAETGRTFIERFEKKWNIGSLNLTLESLLPPELDKKFGHLSMEFLKEYHDHGFEAGMRMLHSKLEAATKEAVSHPKHNGRISVGMALSALLQEVEKVKDEWSVKFVRSLMEINGKRKTLSPKQQALLEEKLTKYGIPLPDYAKFF